MNFCEKCNIACQDERCPSCGRKKLRSVQDDDFCLVVQVDRAFGDSLKYSLENEGIECALIPYGTGVNSMFALPLESCLIYVRYKYLDYVWEIVTAKNQ